MSRPRGRPAKERLVASEEAVKAVKQMLKGNEAFLTARNRCMLLQRKRPTMMRKLNLNTDAYEETGRIEYNRELASRIHPDDRKYMELYEQSMITVWVLEHGVASITDERTRAIAEDTLLKGKSCASLEGKYGMTSRGLRKQKRQAIIAVAAFAESMNFSSVFKPNL